MVYAPADAPVTQWCKMDSAKNFGYTLCMTQKAPNIDTDDIEEALNTLREHGVKPEVIAAVEGIRDRHAAVQRRVKDAIFTNLFSRHEHLLKLYRCLHPEDTSVTEQDLTVLTLENVIANGLRNDLGFAVRNKLFILVEAQSTWSVNIVFRQLCYLVDTWQRWLHRTGQLVYSSGKVELPLPELYVIFPGKSGPAKINLADEFLGGSHEVVDCTVKCIYSWPRSEILGQYIRCAEICDEEIQKWGRDTAKAAEEIRQRCVKEDILADYMQELGGELIQMVEYRTEAELQELLIADSKRKGIEEGRQEGLKEGRQEGIKEGRQEGIKEGRQEGREDIVRNMLASPLLPEQIAQYTQVPLDKVLQIQASMS